MSKTKDDRIQECNNLIDELLSEAPLDFMGIASERLQELWQKDWNEQVDTFKKKIFALIEEKE